MPVRLIHHMIQVIFQNLFELCNISAIEHEMVYLISLSQLKCLAEANRKSFILLAFSGA